MMVEALGVPPDDKFQIIPEHDADGFIADPSYLGIKHPDDVVLVEVTLGSGS